MNIIVPAYFYPAEYGFATWLSVATARAVTDVIANPNSGPGNVIDPIYVNAIAAMKRHSKQVHGYVHTQWGKRDINTVLAEIKRWFEWYAADGIFLDEASTQVADIDYYKKLYDAIPGKVITNQGTTTKPAYSAVSNLVCDRETTWATYEANDTSKPLTVPKYHIITGCSKPGEALILAKSRGVRYVYITDDIEPNPYNKLPTYWRLLNNLAAQLV